jgi:hypothetical protein
MSTAQLHQEETTSDLGKLFEDSFSSMQQHLFAHQRN